MPNYEEIPEFGQLVEYITQLDSIKKDGKDFYGIKINPVDLDSLDLTEEASLDAVLKDINKIIKIKDRVFSTKDVVISKKLVSRINEYMDKQNLGSISNKNTWGELDTKIEEIEKNKVSKEIKKSK